MGENGVDPDQLASEASWSESALFVFQIRYMILKKICAQFTKYDIYKIQSKHPLKF